MEKEKRTLKFSEIFGFGAGGMFTYGFQLMITGYYLLYYMTDIAGFSTVLAASLYSTIQMSVSRGRIIIEPVDEEESTFHQRCPHACCEGCQR